MSRILRAIEQLEQQAVAEANQAATQPQSERQALAAPTFSCAASADAAQAAAASKSAPAPVMSSTAERPATGAVVAAAAAISQAAIEPAAHVNAAAVAHGVRAKIQALQRQVAEKDAAVAGLLQQVAALQQQQVDALRAAEAGHKVRVRRWGSHLLQFESMGCSEQGVKLTGIACRASWRR